MKVSRIGFLIAVILGLILIGYLGAANLPHAGRPPPPSQPLIKTPSPDELRTFFMVRTIISTINAGLAICLLAIYIGIYLRTQARFTVGLVIFTITLLLYAVASNPLLHVLIVSRPYALDLFAGLPELFTTVALVVLLYLSLK